MKIRCSQDSLIDEVLFPYLEKYHAVTGDMKALIFRYEIAANINGYGLDLSIIEAIELRRIITSDGMEQCSTLQWLSEELSQGISSQVRQLPMKLSASGSGYDPGSVDALIDEVHTTYTIT